jgi:hypothetical protein
LHRSNQIPGQRQLVAFVLAVRCSSEMEWLPSSKLTIGVENALYVDDVGKSWIFHIYADLP